MGKIRFNVCLNCQGLYSCENQAITPIDLLLWIQETLVILKKVHRAEEA